MLLDGSQRLLWLLEHALAHCSILAGVVGRLGVVLDMDVATSFLNLVMQPLIRTDPWDTPLVIRKT